MKLVYMKSRKYHYFFFNDKKFVLNSGIHTLTYFHKELRK